LAHFHKGFVVEYASMSFLLNAMESEPILSNRHHNRDTQQTLERPPIWPVDFVVANA